MENVQKKNGIENCSDQKAFPDCFMESIFIGKLQQI